MHREYTPCSECLAQIKDVDVTASWLWNHICHCWTNDANLFEANLERVSLVVSLLCPYLPETLQILENLSYIVTTEVDQEIIVGKLLGVDHENRTVCIRRHLANKKGPSL
jgi:RecB family endonuclease NucS